MKRNNICQDCGAKMRHVKVKVEGARSKALAYDCPKCGNLEFDKESGIKVVEELKHKEESPLMIYQKIVKLSHNRLGTYFNKNIIKSLNLKGGEEIKVSVPDKKHIIIKLF